MKKISMFQMLMVAVLAIGVQMSALAHTHLSVSSPKNGETVSSPTVMMLTFGGEVRLVRVEVKGSAGPIDIGFTPVAAAQTRFHMPMPFMAAGEYVVTWTAIGDDGHSVSDEFAFTVDPSAPAAVMDHGETHSHGSDAPHSH
jgi:hypothetical protein